MGSEFFWFLDLMLIALFAAYIFKGLKKGAVAVLISMCSTIVAFIIGFVGSGVIADAVYNNMIEKQLSSYIDEQINEITDFNIISGLENVNMDKTIVKEKYLYEIKPDFSAGKFVLDLSAADFSKTGLPETDMTIFGIPLDYDYSLVQIGNIAIEKSEYNKYGLNNIVLAHAISANISNSAFKKTLVNIGNKISEIVPVGFEKYGEQIEDESRGKIYELILSIISTQNNNYGSRITNDIISPIILTPLKIILFIALFGLVKFILNLIAKTTQVINRIPVLSSVNQFLGVIFSAIEASILIIIICIILKFIISFFDNSLLFLNDETIERTVLFKYIYAFDPLKITEYRL